MEITNHIHYVGVNDRSKTLFEGLWPLPYGVSYNSYLIEDEKVCLIDTVEADFFPQFLQNIREVIGDRPIDYLVVNHMEPDHSGSISLLRHCYPGIKVIGNAKTFGMLNGFHGLRGNEVEVKNGETLSLGSRELTFVMVPMVHWPETMVTLDTQSRVLFSGDAFGCFGALNGGVLDTRINCDAYWPEMERYYSNIVGKYGTPVQNALKKLAGLQLDFICATHGPVWHEHIGKVMAEYDRMSKYETQTGLVICYGSMYGNTERAAELIARTASEAGIRDIVVHNVSKTHHSYIIRDVFHYKGLILGAPTYNNGLFPEMESLLSELASRDIKQHYLGWFGCHTWASRAVAKIEEWNENRLHFQPVGVPVDIKQSLSPDTAAQCVALGKSMAEKLLADRRALE